MTVISDSIRSVSGVPDDRQITFACSVLRDSDGGDAIVSTRFENVTPVDGEFTVDLDPGPAEVVIRNQKYVFVVPESGPSRLWPLIEDYVPVAAPVVNAAAAAKNAAVSAKTDAEAAAEAAVAAQAAAEAAAGTFDSKIFYDTDGVPYFEPNAAESGASLAADTDGVPFLIGA
jgi:hypothetical protein